MCFLTKIGEMEFSEWTHSINFTHTICYSAKIFIRLCVIENFILFLRRLKI
jgi:hypothetical protein